jgi:hypothetical protein
MPHVLVLRLDFRSAASTLSCALCRSLQVDISLQYAVNRSPADLQPACDLRSAKTFRCERRNLTLSAWAQWCRIY